MEYKFAKGVASLKPSIIREILKSSGNTIPLAAGNPAPDAFPVEDIKKIVNEIFKGYPQEKQYVSIFNIQSKKQK